MRRWQRHLTLIIATFVQQSIVCMYVCCMYVCIIVIFRTTLNNNISILLISNNINTISLVYYYNNIDTIINTFGFSYYYQS